MATDDEKREEVRQFLDRLDAVLGPIAGPKQGAKVPDARRGAAEARRAAPKVSAAPAEGEAVAGRTPRRVRRWGEAARKAAQSEIADGGQALPRSLRAVREAFPLSQRELADRTRLSRSTIAALEGGQRRAHPSTRRVIASVLKVGPGEIAWG